MRRDFVLAWVVGGAWAPMCVYLPRRPPRARTASRSQLGVLCGIRKVQHAFDARLELPHVFGSSFRSQISTSSPLDIATSIRSHISMVSPSRYDSPPHIRDVGGPRPLQPVRCCTWLLQPVPGGPSTLSLSIRCCPAAPSLLLDRY